MMLLPKRIPTWHNPKSDIWTDKTITSKHINLNTMPRALPGDCFHGEIWVKCPHCQSGNEMMGAEPVFVRDGIRVYECEDCGKLFANA